MIRVIRRSRRRRSTITCDRACRQTCAGRVKKQKTVPPHGLTPHGRLICPGDERDRGYGEGTTRHSRRQTPASAEAASWRKIGERRRFGLLLLLFEEDWCCSSRRRQASSWKKQSQSSSSWK